MKLRLVFVHLGEAEASHLWSNIKHILRNHPESQIDVITSKTLSKPPISNSHVKFYTYQADEKISAILDYTSIDSSFRKGFWRYALERLFALTAHHQNHPDQPLLHIESDFLLLPNFPFETFQSLTKPAWLKFDITRDIAGILYIPNSSKSEWLSQIMTQELQKRTQMNDMQLLSAISTKYPESVTILPSSSSENSRLFSEDRFLSADDRRTVSSEFDKFDGIFDPLAMGTWLAGNDPRNAFGITRRFDTTSLLKGETYVDPSKGSFTFSKTEGLAIIDSGLKVKVFNLHVHSKNERLFNDGWESELLSFVEASKFLKIQKTFSPKILLDLIFSNYRNGTFLRFILWVPFLSPVRRFLPKIKRLLY